MRATTLVEFIETSKDFKHHGIKRTFEFNFDFIKMSEKDRIIEGYACTTHKDRYEDIITMEAIEGSKNDLLQKGSNTVFFNHNYDQPIGKVLSSVVDNTGLKVKIMISKAPDVRNVWKKIKEGVVKCLSIGGRFKKLKIERDEDGRILSVQIMSMELYEVSVVGIPANPEAEIFSVVGKMLHLEEKNMKTEKTEKVENKEESKVKIEEVKSELLEAKEVKSLTKEEVVEMIKESNKTLIEMIKELLPKQEVKQEIKEEKKEEVKEVKEVMPEWAKNLSEKVEKLVSKRKGFDAAAEDEESEEEQGIKKSLVGAKDPESIKFVKFAMNNPEVYEKLSAEEKVKANSIYFVLLDASSRKDS